MGIANQMTGAMAGGGGSPGNPPPLPSAASYFVALNNQQTGPFDMAALQQKLRDGSLTRSTLVWKQGMPGWAAADTVPELQPLFAALPPPLPTP